MTKKNLKEKMAEDIHDGLRGYIQFVLSQGVSQPNGSIKIRKSQVDRWRRIMNSSHNKLRSNEKEWAVLVVAKLVKTMNTFKKNSTVKITDSRVAEIKETFVEYCKNLRHFVPIINHGRDDIIIKQRLKDYSKEEILDCFDWFLTDKGYEKFSPSISTALSVSIFNRFLSQK